MTLTSMQASLLPVMMLGEMGAAILGFLQRLIFQSHAAAAVTRVGDTAGGVCYAIVTRPPRR